MHTQGALFIFAVADPPADTVCLFVYNSLLKIRPGSAIIVRKNTEDDMLKIIVCILAGLGAGLGTGFAGMSAAAVIAPMLITFLDIPAYEAVGIAL